MTIIVVLNIKIIIICISDKKTINEYFHKYFHCNGADKMTMFEFSLCGFCQAHCLLSASEYSNNSRSHYLKKRYLGVSMWTLKSFVGVTLGESKQQMAIATYYLVCSRFTKFASFIFFNLIIL